MHSQYLLRGDPSFASLIVSAEIPLTMISGRLGRSPSVSQHHDNMHFCFTSAPYSISASSNLLKRPLFLEAERTRYRWWRNVLYLLETAQISDRVPTARVTKSTDSRANAVARLVPQLLTNSLSNTKSDSLLNIHDQAGAFHLLISRRKAEWRWRRRRGKAPAYAMRLA